MLDIIIILVIVVLMLNAIRIMTKHKSCGHNCTSCNGCSIQKDEMLKYYYENK